MDPPGEVRSEPRVSRTRTEARCGGGDVEVDPTGWTDLPGGVRDGLERRGFGLPTSGP